MKNIFEDCPEGGAIMSWQYSDDYYWRRNFEWTKVDGAAVTVIEGKARCSISFLEDEQCYLLRCMLLENGEVIEKRFLSAVAAKYDCLTLLKKRLIVERRCPREKCNGRVRLQDQKGRVYICSEKHSSHEIWKDIGVGVWQCNACEQYAFDLSTIDFPTLSPDK